MKMIAASIAILSIGFPCDLDHIHSQLNLLHSIHSPSPSPPSSPPITLWGHFTNILSSTQNKWDAFFNYFDEMIEEILNDEKDIIETNNPHVNTQLSSTNPIVNNYCKPHFLKHARSHSAPPFLSIDTNKNQ
jgi:hypothetical protein